MSGTAKLVRSPSGRVRVAPELEPALGDQHADRLDGIERNAIGPGKDRAQRRFRERRHEAEEQLAHRRLVERLEEQAREVALARAPVRPPLQQFRPREGQHEDRPVAAPLEQVVDEVERPAIGPMEVLEDHRDGRDLGQPLEERAPRGEQLFGAHARLDAEQHEQRALDPAALLRIGDVLLDACRDPRARRRLVVALAQARAAPDHLAQRPERDPLAVRGAAAVVPPDALKQAVDVLEELPGEPALADPGRPDDGHQPGALLARRRVEEVLELAQLLVAADERRLHRFAPVAATDLGDDAQGAPRPDRGDLALQDLLACLLEYDRGRGGLERRLADQHGSGGRDRLQARGGVDEVAGDHALIGRTDRDRGLAGEHAGAGLDTRREPADGGHEIEACADGPLGVVLGCDRGAPDGHHGIADELLDRAAVAPDHVPGEVEVAAQGLARLLGVALLGERREADEVREQDRDHPPLGDGRRRGRRGSWLAGGRLRDARDERGAALAAELRVGGVGRAAVGATGRETGAAFAAELAAGLVLRAAVRAACHRPRSIAAKGSRALWWSGRRPRRPRCGERGSGCAGRTGGCARRHVQLGACSAQTHAGVHAIRRLGRSPLLDCRRS